MAGEIGVFRDKSWIEWELTEVGQVMFKRISLFEDLIKLKACCLVMPFTAAFENDLCRSLTLVVGRQELMCSF